MVENEAGRQPRVSPCSQVIRLVGSNVVGGVPSTVEPTVALVVNGDTVLVVPLACWKMLAGVIVVERRLSEGRMSARTGDPSRHVPTRCAR